MTSYYIPLSELVVIGLERLEPLTLIIVFPSLRLGFIHQRKYSQHTICINYAMVLRCKLKAGQTKYIKNISKLTKTISNVTLFGSKVAPILLLGQFRISCEIKLPFTRHNNPKLDNF